MEYAIGSIDGCRPRHQPALVVMPDGKRQVIPSRYHHQAARTILVAEVILQRTFGQIVVTDIALPPAAERPRRKPQHQ